MSPADVLLALHGVGAVLRVERGRLLAPDGLADELLVAIVRWRNVLPTLLTAPVEALCEGMTTDEREAFDERAAVLEHDGGFPRELAERAAVWWARTPTAWGTEVCCEVRCAAG
jgi:hypothetical protein